MVVPARDGRPLLLIDLAVPRDIDPACAELPGVTLLDVDGAAAPGARATSSVRRDRGAQGRGHRRGRDPGVRGLARARSRCMPTLTALRTRADDVVERAAGRERGPLGVAVRRATASASRSSPAPRSSTAAARADRARAPARRRAPPRPAARCCASCSGSTSSRRRPSAGEGGEVRPLRRRGAS